VYSKPHARCFGVKISAMVGGMLARSNDNHQFRLLVAEPSG
jgi:hypothetical protein